MLQGTPSFPIYAHSSYSYKAEADFLTNQASGWSDLLPRTVPLSLYQSLSPKYHYYLYKPRANFLTNQSSD